MVIDCIGNKLKKGDTVICVEKSNLFPNLIDSIIGKKFKITYAGYMNTDINPGYNIVLDVHPILSREDNIEYLAALPRRFKKVDHIKSLIENVQKEISKFINFINKYI